MKLVTQSTIVIFAFVFVHLLRFVGALEQVTPILGVFMFLYIITSLKRNKDQKYYRFKEAVNLFSLLTLILILILITGGLSSLLFYTLYFVCFTIVFAFLPETVFVFALATLLFFLPEALERNTMENLIKLGALLALSPIGYFFGKAANQTEKIETMTESLKADAAEAGDLISTDIRQVLESEKDRLSPEDQAKLTEALEEAELLKEETKR
jgi:signal transduction histidine kinase